MVGPWAILGIEPTRDELTIRKAYARKLREFRPDEDPEGFQKLVAARDRALNWRWPARPATESPKSEDQPQKSTAEILLDIRRDADAEVNEIDARMTTSAEEINAPTKSVDPLIASQQLAMAAASADFNALIAGERDAGDKDTLFSATEKWKALVHTLNELTIHQRNTLRARVISQVLPRLPELEITSELFNQYRAGTGPMAVVELLESEFRIGDLQIAAAPRLGNPELKRYFAWLGKLAEMQSLVERTRKGKPAYRDANGLPVIPPRDLYARIWVVKWRLSDSQSDVLYKAYLLDAQRLGRWPRVFSWHAFILPRADFILSGLGELAVISLVLESYALWLLEAGRASLPFWGSIAILSATVLVFHVSAALYGRRLAIYSLVRRVKRLDRRGTLGKDRATSLRLTGRLGGTLLGYAGLIDVVMLFSLLNAVIVVSHRWP